MNAVDESSFHTCERTTITDNADPTAITQSNASGWHRYKNALTRRKVKESTHRWYVLHVKAFLSLHYS